MSCGSAASSSSTRAKASVSHVEKKCPTIPPRTMAMRMYPLYDMAMSMTMYCADERSECVDTTSMCPGHTHGASKLHGVHEAADGLLQGRGPEPILASWQALPAVPSKKHPFHAENGGRASWGLRARLRCLLRFVVALARPLLRLVVRR